MIPDERFSMLKGIIQDILDEIFMGIFTAQFSVLGAVQERAIRIEFLTVVLRNRVS
ncbi:hypothetical protein GCM10009720_23460 [Yaniella flava]|uniref:Uncharacterized protein n=1 Tax=Yaniella flava TaxID=287930 RepID=A0ABP5G8S3_9MICC|nr:hypothetical protein [Micrococcaceae bacterium]